MVIKNKRYLFISNLQERDYVMNQFRNGRSTALIATDVASRGLDIKDIDVVVNYDMPKVIEDYVHRIGRTGMII